MELGESGWSDGDVPAVVVDPSVVVLAQQDEVGQVGWSSVGPVDDVVGVAPRRWPVAAGEGAAGVAGGECAALRDGDESLGASDVERLALAAEDDGDDASVAGETSGCPGADGAGVVHDWQLARRLAGQGVVQLLLQGVGVDGDGDVGTFAAFDR